jgi:hypothetical protein
MRLALLLVSAAMAVACGGVGQRPAPDEKPSMDVTAETLYEDYKADGAKAASRYAGKVLRVTMKVDKADQSGNDLSIRQDFGRMDHVYAHIPVKDAGRVAVGKTVTIRGKVVGSGAGDVRLGDCILE